MPEIINGEECLHTKEAAHYLGWSFVTLQKYLKNSGFPYWNLPGHGGAKYWRKSDLDKLKQPRQGQ
jgi:hypothetical protein